MKNGVMLQAFEWDLPSDGTFYSKLADQAEHLSQIGITGIWMPPAAKGTSAEDTGYGNYDFWDLGEFDQKGTVRTKYGTRAELEACIDALHKQHIQVYADMVFNHKGGADYTETFKAVPVNPENRNEEVSEPYDIEGWTRFSFEGRQKAYSDFEWHFYHFDGVDFDQKTGNKGIYRIIGENKSWDQDTDSEKGNYDYLMNADIDHSHPDVEAELFRVADFMADDLHYDGFRYDALKHISSAFIDNLSAHLLEKYPHFYFVGEYWQDDQNTINYYLDKTDYQVDLFDVPLHFNLYQASTDKGFDMRTIFDGTLVKKAPTMAVTFVDNHDSQPGQALESWVEPWFKEIAYALILLRQGGYPCVFWGDYAGISGSEYKEISDALERMLTIREKYNYGDQDDYFESSALIGWVRRGNEEHPGRLAVLISTGSMAELSMFVGEDQAGKTYRDASGKNEDIIIGEDGKGLFTVPPGAVTYWVERTE